MARNLPAADRPLRTAVLGYGVGGRLFHSPHLAASPGYSLDAVVTRDPGRAAEVTARYPGTRVLAGAEEVLAEPERYDLVVVTTPNETHVPLALAAIGQGIPVVVDKPLAATAAAARELLAAAEAAGVPLTVYQNRRWDGDFLTLRRLLDEGALGTVHQLESRFSWWDPTPAAGWKTTTTVADGGGALFDLGPHLVDQAVQLFGPVASWHAELDVCRPGVVADDDSFLALTHVSGVRSRLWMSCVTAQAGPRFRVLGSQGAFTKHHLDPQEEQAIAGVRPDDPRFGVEDETRWGTLGVDGATTRVPTERGAHGTFYALLETALRTGGPVPVDPRDSIAVLELIEDVHARTGLAGR